MVVMLRLAKPMPLFLSVEPEMPELAVCPGACAGASTVVFAGLPLFTS